MSFDTVVRLYCVCTDLVMTALLSYARAQDNSDNLNIHDNEVYDNGNHGESIPLFFQPPPRFGGQTGSTSSIIGQFERSGGLDIPTLTSRFIWFLSLKG